MKCPSPPWTFLFVLAFSPACGSGDSDSPGDDGRCAAIDFEPFDATIAHFVDSHSLKGASSVVVQKDCGVVHAAGYGAYAADRVYLVGSSSKVVSAGILVRLADQGLLDLDAPICQYVSAWGANGKPELEVAQLLSNSSGLVGLVDKPFYLPYRCQYQDAGALSDCAATIYTAHDAADRVAPDTSFHYGGAQWQLAGGVAEAVSGKTWAELVRETYGIPCNTADFGYTNQFDAAGASGGLGSALSYPEFFQGDVASLPVTDNPNIEGGLYVTVQDYAKILLLHLRGGECEHGRVLFESSVARMRVDRILEKYDGTTAGMTGRTNGGTAFEGYGLGWWIDRAHPGVFADPGVYGAFPWLDLPRNYGAFLALEADGNTGAELWQSVKPLLDDAFDSALH
jgi:CubicO group peptidase (beta-lactamase class C family)